MDLSTEYLGLKLAHPFMPGASPMSEHLDHVRRLEDAGAPAITMHSLFEEQIVMEELATRAAIDRPADSFAEALSYFPTPSEFRLGPDEYLEQVRRIKAAVKVPVIASLNGTTTGGWLRYARLIADAGADALELNAYVVATDPARTGAHVEERTLEMVHSVRQAISIPIAVKLSPFYASVPNIVARLAEAGASGVVIFNRFYRPDIDIEALEVRRSLELSTSSELRLRLRFLAILSGRVPGSLAVTGVVHTAADAIAAIMTGAHGVQMVSALLKNGPEHLKRVRGEVEAWVEAHEYTSLDQMRGSLNLARSGDPAAFERANYMHILSGWRP
jgi:dihydroorotate dehydrogenase (fumarate)